MWDDPLVIQLRELSRVDEDLGREVSRLTNHLRKQLHRFYVQALKECPSADEPWLWALLDLAPSPAAGSRLPRKTIERLLRQHRIRRLNAQDVLDALGAKALQVAPGWSRPQLSIFVAVATLAPGPHSAPALRRAPGRLAG